MAPINAPVCSPMAESFVDTFKRDYADCMDLKDTRGVFGQLPAAYGHYNRPGVHPHSALKMMSPVEFRQQQAEEKRRRETLLCG